MRCDKHVKRDIYKSKKTYKRDLHTSNETHTRNQIYLDWASSTGAAGAGMTHMSKETYIRQKRSTKDTYFLGVGPHQQGAKMQV